MEEVIESKIAFNQDMLKTLLLEKTQLKTRLSDIEKWEIQIRENIKKLESTRLSGLKKQHNSKWIMSKVLEVILELEMPKRTKSTIYNLIKKQETGSVTVGTTQTEQVQTNISTDTAHTYSPFSTESPLKSLKKK